MGYFSNGTEGAIFEERFCSRCAHSDYREGKDFGDRDNPPCPIWMAHLLYAYELCNEDAEKNPGKQMLDMLIRPVKKTASDGIEYFDNECQMFHAKDAGAEIEGQTRLELA